MEFHDNIVLICGDGGGLGLRIARSVLKRGARTAVLVGAAAGDSAFHPSGNGELLCIADEGLGRLRDAVGSIRESGQLNTVINLVKVDKPRLIDRAAGAPEDSGIATSCEAVVRETDRIVLATRDLLRRSQPRGAMVNVGILSPATGGAVSAAASAALGSLKALTQSLARELAPHTRVNAVLLGGIGAPAGWSGSLHEEEDVGPVVFLASSAARHMTGTILTADAGHSLGFAAFSKPHDGTVEQRAR
jgi:NAD(P)-dependent dehydrogenase (short-subunit alcohol dehydrogenase family)